MKQHLNSTLLVLTEHWIHMVNIAIVYAERRLTSWFLHPTKPSSKPKMTSSSNISLRVRWCMAILNAKYSCHTVLELFQSVCIHLTSFNVFFHQIQNWTIYKVLLQVAKHSFGDCRGLIEGASARSLSLMFQDLLEEGWCFTWQKWVLSTN